MSDLRDLYQELILDHTKRPRNFGRLENANCTADGHNPLCGDKLTLFLDVDNDVVKDVRFQGSGCAISTASASMMTESIKGKTRAETEALFQRFHQMLTGPEGVELEDDDELGKLVVFSGVREFPVRVKCATLAWHTLNAALKHQAEPASTE
jgi:nitrogen fixation NifU-like protein